MQKKASGKKHVAAEITIPYLMFILSITKVLGFLKFTIFARLFGTSPEMDAFWAAFTIPDLIFNALVAGSVNAAIIPVFSKILHKDGDARLAYLFRKLNFYITLALIFCSALVFIFAKDISIQLAGGGTLAKAFDVSINYSTTDLDLLARLMRILTLSPIILGVSSLVTAYIQVYKKFIPSAVSPLMYNLGMIIGSLLLVGIFKTGIEGVAVAVVLGSLLHLAVQLPTAIKIFKANSSDKTKDGKMLKKDIIDIVKLSIPRTVALFAEQINVIVNTIVSFTVTAGALAAYKYAFSLSLFPVHIITGSISTVSLTSLAELHNNENREGFKKSFNESVQMSVFLIAPFAIILLFLRLPIVRLAYGSGNFDWWATVFTSWSLALLSFGMVGQVVSAVTVRAFYAVQETKLPLITTILSIVVNLVCAYYFTNFFSHYMDWRPILGQIVSQFQSNKFSFVTQSFIQDVIRWSTERNNSDYAIGGVGLSYSVACIFDMVVNLLLLNFKVKVISWHDTILPFIKKLVVFITTAAATYLMYRYSDKVFNTIYVKDVVIVLGLSTFTSFVVYFGLSMLLDIQECSIVLDKIRSYILTAFTKISRKLSNG